MHECIRPHRVFQHLDRCVTDARLAIQMVGVKLNRFRIAENLLIELEELNIVALDENNWHLNWEFWPDFSKL